MANNWFLCVKLTKEQFTLHQCIRQSTRIHTRRLQQLGRKELEQLVVVQLGIVEEPGRMERRLAACRLEPRPFRRSRIPAACRSRIPLIIDKGSRCF